MSGQSAPSLASNHKRNSCLGKSKLSCEGTLSPAPYRALANISNKFCSEFSGVMGLSPSDTAWLCLAPVAPLHSHICHVGSCISDKQVSGIHAIRHITRMQNVHAWRDSSASKLPRNAMSERRCVVRASHTAVSTGVLAANPMPASRGFLHFFKETFFQCSHTNNFTMNESTP